MARVASWHVLICVDLLDLQAELWLNTLRRERYDMRCNKIKVDNDQSVVDFHRYQIQLEKPRPPSLVGIQSGRVKHIPSMKRNTMLDTTKQARCDPSLTPSCPLSRAHEACLLVLNTAQQCRLGTLVRTSLCLFVRNLLFL